MKVPLIVVALLACADAPAAILGMPSAHLLLAQGRTVSLAGPTSCVTGDTLTYTASATDIHGNTATPMFGWSSSNVAVAPFVSVDSSHQSARVLCATVGQTIITISWTKRYTASRMLTVNTGGPPPPPPPPPPPVTDTTLPPDRQANLTLVFDPNTTIANSTRTGPTPTAVGTPTYNAGPPKRYDFTAAQAIDFGASALNSTFQSAYGFTIITVVQTGVTGDINYIATKEDGTLSNFALHRNGVGDFEFVVRNPSPNYEFVESTHVLDSNVVVLAASYNPNNGAGARSNIYLGGSLASATHTFSGTMSGVAATTAPLRLGINGGNTHVSVPAIGATYIYNVALTSTELANNVLWINARKRWTMPIVAAVDHVNVTPISASALVGATQQFSAVAYNAMNAPVTGQTFVWASSDATKATINSSTGLATAVAAGSASITAATAGKTGTGTFTVQAPASCSLLTDWNAHSQPALTKPAYLASVTDPVFGTTITRISGNPGTASGLGWNWPNVVKQNYPKDPVWSADGTLIVLKEMSGVPSAGAALFIDGNTYAPLFTRGGPPDGLAGEWRMHPTIPDVAVVLSSTGVVRHWNVRTNTITVKIAAVAGYTSHSFGPNEGGLSYDGKYIVAKATRTSDNHTVARVLNVDDGTTGVVIDLTAAGAVNIDWVSISAGGGYVIAFATFDGVAQRTKVWNRSTGASVAYWQDYSFGHPDFGIDGQGREIMFGGVASASTINKHFIARQLATGTVSDRTPGVATSYSWHSSERNNTRLGWGYVATNDITGAITDGEIYSIALDGTQRILRLAHHRSVGSAYNDDPHPVPSPDGKRVAFSSDWGVAGGMIQAYVVDTRSICPNLP